jgi:hypothetical protein
MTALAAALLVLVQDPSKAGAAYQEGLSALQDGRPDAAAARFQEALRQLPEEDPRLQYRDREGRHSVAYHPRFGLAQARAAQALADPAKVEELLGEAVALLGLSRHPDAPALLEELRKRIDDARAARAAAQDSAAVAAAVRKRVDALCEEQRYEDALAAARGVVVPRERSALTARIEARRQEVVDGCLRAMRTGLDSVAALDPVEKADALPGLLEPGRVPAAVQASPPPPLVWLGRFAELLERRRAQIRGASELPGPDAVALAEAFDRAAAEADQADCPSGARAARAVARGVLRARIEARPGKDLPLLLGEAGRRWAPQAGERDADLEPWRKRIAAVRDEAQARSLREERAWTALRLSEALLSDPERMSDETALEAGADALERLEADLRVQELEAPLQARLAFVLGLLRATRGWLAGESEEAVVRRAGPALERAWRLDADLIAERRASVSPRLGGLIDRVRPR